MRTEAQSYVRASETSEHAVSWILGGIATLLLILVALAIFVHIEIQPTELLLGGAFVGAVAVSLFMLNASFSAPSTSASQAAAVAGSFERSILVGEGSSTERLP
jgi:hypothetical protein